MSDKTTNKITFGLSNVHIWPITSTDDTGKPTYGTVFAQPGATEMSFDAKGSSDPFYADDGIYYRPVSNTGYSGKLTVADLVSAFRTQILKEIVDKNGAIFENADVQPSEFAIAFEIKGDVKKRRFLFYRCLATRPGISSSTKEDKIDPNKSELDFSASPRIDNGYVKVTAEEGDTAYSDWYGTAPYEYVDSNAATS